MSLYFGILLFISAGGKCSQQAELSGENINITYKPDGTHVAVGNRVCYTIPSFYYSSEVLTYV